MLLGKQPKRVVRVETRSRLASCCFLPVGRARHQYPRPTCQAVDFEDGRCRPELLALEAVGLPGQTQAQAQQQRGEQSPEVDPLFHGPSVPVLSPWVNQSEVSE